ncbi:MAG: helix-turn-helix domain-containing protein [Labilibaculum sp.]|nr:helix-turn-helix domain-containing protein [Labilibaculum sp.]
MLQSKIEKTYSRNEVCEILHITLPTLWKKTKAGVITSVKFGSRVLYNESEILRILEGGK